MNDLTRLLILPRIKIQNANALSSPFTIGFPAVTAWLGAVHALQRHCQKAGFSQLSFTGVGVVSHQFDLQTHRGSGDFVSSIIGTGNPLDKDGNRPSFIEEARAHLTVTLVVEYHGIAPEQKEAALITIQHILNSQLKIAGGDILTIEKPYFSNTDSATNTSKLMRKLMPGYALVERRELIEQAMVQGQDALEALIDNVAVHHSCTQNNDTVTWQAMRKNKGWLVPIAVGYQGISPLGQALNQRDTDTPHRFAEAVVTLGEFKMAYHIESINEVLWRYDANPENDLYVCTTQHNNTSNTLNDLSQFF